ncbi:MAG TPA: lysophospholipid acyltransferase family protein [Nitrospiria bacterium]|nr:lysophospholipid acyltransferase family protein [Nitrospiria bacterium]
MNRSNGHEGSDPPHWYHTIWHVIGLLWWTVIMRVLNRVAVLERTQIPRRGAVNVLICSNHLSALDPFFIAVVAMPRCSPVWWRAPAKEELFDLPVVKTVLHTWGAFPVKRGQRDSASIERIVRLLPTSVIVIFPEGTRSETGRLLPGRRGVGKVIYEAKPTVIPVAIAGTDRILPKGHMLPRVGHRATIAFGPPVDLDRFYSEPDSPELSQRIVDTVMEAIGDLYQTICSS